jgi:hypothetical protein
MFAGLALVGRLRHETPALRTRVLLNPLLMRVVRFAKSQLCGCSTQLDSLYF